MNPALVCIPTYNERDNLEPITRAVLAADPRVDILVVDDNCPDGTGQLADELAAKEPRVRVLHREKKQGLGRAYLHAFRWALERATTYIIEMDADFSHDPRYLPTLLDAAHGRRGPGAGLRYVDGRRHGELGPGPQGHQPGRLALRAHHPRAWASATSPAASSASPPRCSRRIDLDAVKSTGYAFQIELTYRTLKKGFRVKEIPIVFEDRRVGQSKMSRKIFLEALTMVWKLRLTV